MEGYKISTNIDDMDMDMIHAYICKTYWAEAVPEATLAKAINNSLCFGVFTDSGQQIGFRRMVTDLATFAYMADVFILEEYQGRGLGKWLIQEMKAHPDMQGLRRINLATKDAQSLYQQFGFKPLSNPDSMMEIIDLNVYVRNTL